MWLGKGTNKIHNKKRPCLVKILRVIPTNMFIYQLFLIVEDQANMRLDKSNISLKNFSLMK